jgi:Raf kinase inhibitor-like YbhB/YbcL family protein
MMRSALKILIASAALVLATSVAVAAALKLSSPDFKNGGAIPDKNSFNSFGCSGENVSPALEWSNPPEGTKSFALLMHDPDAPTGGSGFWHWLVYDIPATTTSLPAGAGKGDGSALPAGAKQGHNDFGAVGYGGPCPPPGSKHHYNFTLYPLKVEKLDVQPNATAAVVGFTVNANVIGKPVKLTGIYARKK